MKTFDEWGSLGYKIIKGSKATWVDGIAKFSKAQVEKYNKKSTFSNFGPLDEDFSICNDHWQP